MEQSFFQSAGVYCYNEFQIPILNSNITVTSKKNIYIEKKNTLHESRSFTLSVLRHLP